MSLLPYVSKTGDLIDGEYFHLLPFCKANCHGKKCVDHYKIMACSDTGAYCCPYGLSSYVYSSPDGKRVFTGLRIKGVYNKKRAKIAESKEYIYNPTVDSASCGAIVQEEAISHIEMESLKSKLAAVEDLLHEARSLNSQIKNSIDLLWETNTDEDSIDYDMLITTLKNAHVSSFMIANRFSYFDSVLNPALSLGEPYSAVVFKKFDKMRKLLKGYNRKNVRISIDSPSQSNYRYNIYPTFETLLFLLLENAIKYAPNSSQIDVTFNENGHLLDVVIKSTGPYCDENEILHICEKGFRGQNARAAEERGQGFGLNFAKKISDMHGIGIDFQSVYSHKDHGVKYGTFLVRLHFDNEIKRISTNVR